MKALLRTLCLLVATQCMSGVMFAADPAAMFGRVIDKATRYPVPGANVILGDKGLGACANSEGYFEVKSLPAGTYRIQVSVLGYTPVTRDLTFHEGENKQVTFELSETVYELNPVTVTATREKSLVSEVPSSVDVVSFRDLDRRNIQNISQAVEDIPGVFTQDYGGLGDLKTISIRGSSSSQVLILVDGQRVNNAQSGDVDLGTIPVEGVDRIEVVRGGASALYGADAVGGVINIITKSKPYQSSMGGSTKILAGSFGTRGVDVGGSFSSDRFFSVLSYKYLATDGDFKYRTPLGAEVSRINADLASHGVFAKGTWGFGNEALPGSLSLSGQYSYIREGAPGAIDQLKPLARKKNQNELFNVVYDQKLWNPYNSIRFQSYYHNYEFLFDDPDPYIPEHSYNHNMAAGAELQGRIVFNEWNAVTTGYAYRRDRASSTALEEIKDRSLHSIYVQDELSPALSEGMFVRRVVVIPAARWDHFSDFGGQVSPKIGLVVSTGDPWQASLKSNYGSSFRAPSFNDLYWPKDAYSKGNPDLKPERGRDFDVGVMIRHPLFLGLGLDVTYFSNSVDELILWQPNAVGLWTPRNIGKAAIKGVETRVSFNPWRDLFRLEWNYTYIDARNKTQEATQFDNQIPYRARNVHNVSARVDLTWIYLYANVSYSGKRYTNTANTISLKPFHVTEALIGYKPPLDPPWMEMKLEVKNLEDLHYQVMDGFPMPGREFRFSVEVKLTHERDTN